jgi:hypothetical protein
MCKNNRTPPELRGRGVGEDRAAAHGRVSLGTNGLPVYTGSPTTGMNTSGGITGPCIKQNQTKCEKAEHSSREYKRMGRGGRGGSRTDETTPWPEIVRNHREPNPLKENVQVERKWP